MHELIHSNQTSALIRLANFPSNFIYPNPKRHLLAKHVANFSMACKLSMLINIIYVLLAKLESFFCEQIKKIKRPIELKYCATANPSTILVFYFPHFFGSRSFEIFYTHNSHLCSQDYTYVLRPLFEFIATKISGKLNSGRLLAHHLPLDCVAIYYSVNR